MKNIGRLKKSYSKGYSSVAQNPINLIKKTLSKNYFKCEIFIFGDTFSGHSENEGKAKFKVTEKCKKKHREAFCKELECTKF